MKTEGCDKVCLLKGTSKSGSFFNFWTYVGIQITWSK